MNDETQRASDQALTRRTRRPHGPRAARMVLRLVLLVVAGVASLPSVAVAHDYENPGFNGARLYVEMYEGTVPASSYQQPVKGIDFAPNQPVQVFQCPTSAPVDPRDDCVVAGAAVTKADGSFEAKVVVSAGMPTKDVYCAPTGTSQCYMVAATYAVDKPTELTSDAEHHLCFSVDFNLWPLINDLQGQPDEYEECAGPPAPTVTTTTTVPPPPEQWAAGS